MSRFTYAGPFKNPTEGFYIKELENEEGARFEVWARSPRNEDGSAPPDRPHSKGCKFLEYEDAEEWIASLHDFFEQDYDEYLEENHHEIARMEAYEDWRNEQ